MYVQRCCRFAYLNLLLFCRSPSRRRRRCLSYLMSEITHPVQGNPRQSWILDSTPWILDSRDWIPVLSVELEFWIPNLHYNVEDTYVDTPTLINKLSKMTRNVK